MNRKALPPLSPQMSPQTRIERPLSVPEYYHASVGTHAATLEIPREIVFVLEGRGHIDPETLQSAVDAATRHNPGARLRLHGHCLMARWVSDGAPIRVRVANESDWDGYSEQGTAFVSETPLSLREGICGEMILQPLAGDRQRIILRILHAVMDGKGVMHFWQDVFRAMRDEPLAGTNAAISDTDIMKSQAGPFGERHGAALPLAPRTEDTHGDSWRRLSITGPVPGLLAETALALASFARRVPIEEETKTVTIAVPVDLRRHVPGLQTTANCASMLHVSLGPTDDAAAFRNKLRALLDARSDAAWRPVFDVMKIVPLRWVDWLLSRRPDNHLSRQLLETAVISNLGRFEPDAFYCPAFTPDSLYGIPIPGNAFVFLFGLGDNIEVVAGMPNSMAGEGRLEALMEWLETRLRPTTQAASSPAPAGEAAVST